MMDVAEIQVGDAVVFIDYHSFSITSTITPAIVKRITKTRVTFEIRPGYDKVYVVDKFGRLTREVGLENYRSDHVYLADGPEHRRAEINKQKASLIGELRQAGEAMSVGSRMYFDEERIARAEAAIAAVRKFQQEHPDDE